MLCDPIRQMTSRNSEMGLVSFNLKLFNSVDRYQHLLLSQTANMGKYVKQFHNSNVDVAITH